MSATNEKGDFKLHKNRLNCLEGCKVRCRITSIRRKVCFISYMSRAVGTRGSKLLNSSNFFLLKFRTLSLFICNEISIESVIDLVLALNL